MNLNLTRALEEKMTMISSYYQYDQIIVIHIPVVLRIYRTNENLVKKFVFYIFLHSPTSSFWLMIMLGFRQKLANNGTEAHMEEEDALAVGYEVSCGLGVSGCGWVGYEVRCALPKLIWWLQLLVGWLIG